MMESPPECKLILMRVGGHGLFSVSVTRHQLRDEGVESGLLVGITNHPEFPEVEILHLL